MMTHSPVGKLEYTSFPMPRPSHTYVELFEGNHVYTYLEAFAQSKTWGEKTLKDRIILNTTVSKVDYSTNPDNTRLWHLQTTSGKSYTCNKLIVASGLTFIPHLPTVKKIAFTPPIIHSRELAAQSPFLLGPSVKNVTVIGGAKSSFDTVQMLCKASKSVTWIIRTSGQGPAFMAPPQAPPPLKNSNELISIRLITKLSPSIFEPMDAWDRFFHHNKFGIWLTRLFWGMINAKWLKASGYDRNEEMVKLRPQRPVFWSSDTVAVCNSGELWDQVSKAKVVRGEINDLDGDDVVMVAGERIKCDALVCCTGWKTTYPFFDTAQAEEMGLPVLLDEVSSKEKKKWENLIATADEEVLRRFPALSEAPNLSERIPIASSAHLYRFMVPTSPKFDDGSIVVLGHFITRDTFILAEVQALWAAAYLKEQLILPSTAEKEKDVALVAAWRRRRYLSDGHTFLFDGFQASPINHMMSTPILI
jgi:dimethylaniline monooxygenase (N-oxide forming)